MKVAVLYDELNYVRMWRDNGHDVIPSKEFQEADVVQFTGGADVTPSLYEEDRHPTTQPDPMRDDHEIWLFEECLSLGIPMAGICRGGQFLNVMSGGRLWQDVDGHAIGGTHLAVDTRTGKMIDVTSTHHQMMRAGEGGEVLLVASEANKLDKMQGNGIVTVPAKRGEDVEAVWYPETQCLCYQPHPEYMGGTPCQQWYFERINEFIGE